LNWPNGIAITR